MPANLVIRRILIGLVLISLSTGLVVWFFEPLSGAVQKSVAFVADRHRIENFITSFGWGAPLAFMAVQVLQVLIAPVPGEATGFIGGYLFGTFPGFFYSSLALSAGSWLNFIIGRFLGERFVRKWIPPKQLAKFERLLKRQGVIIVILLFVLPGFPKDWLCLFLGMSSLPLRIFLPIAVVGRMPGTMLLSLQGAFLFEKNYLLLTVFIAISLLLAYIAFRWREKLYLWVARDNNKGNTEH
jgi:uncharacterized membrane protein YdjX (TVP38/TMEM64 family)